MAITRSDTYTRSETGAFFVFLASRDSDITTLRRGSSVHPFGWIILLRHWGERLITKRRKLNAN